jgi:DNA-binding SARP family transcriptional activator
VLRLNLFGTGQLRYSGRALPGFPRHQPHLLICYLALYPHRAHSREHLAAAFWGDRPTSDSLKYLRNALWRLRQALQSIQAPDEHYLHVADDAISLCGQDHLWLDTREFEERVACCRRIAGPELTAEQAASLESAVCLYSGDLLQDVYEDWCIYERERFQLLYLGALSKLMDYYEVRGEYELALDHGERILERDNTRERTHQRMMRLYWLLGDRGAALAQYSRCAQILQESLHLPPMARTRHLYQQMVRGDFPSALHTADSATGPTERELLGENGDRLEQALLRLQQIEQSVEQARMELRQATGLIRALIGFRDLDEVKDPRKSASHTYGKTVHWPS